MIKYLELTPPDDNAFRHAKIVSIDCAEGDRIAVGSTLFTVKNGRKKINLPSTMDGKVVEIIATVGESISPSTALVLLETEVEGSTASAPINNDDIESQPVNKLITEKTASAKRTKKTPKAPVKHEQQMLNLSGDDEPVRNISTADTDQAKSNKPQKQETLNQSPATNPSPSNAMPSNSTIQISVPDIGADSAKVIEVLVQVGDSVSAEDPLITLESDKASMDVPSTHAGVISAIKVSLDQDVSEGTIIVELESTETQTATPEKAATPEKVNDPIATPQAEEEVANPSRSNQPSDTEIVSVKIPDIGGDSAKVIEILVNVGQTIDVEEALVTLESDKASMEVPSPVAGTLQSIDVQLDQEVNEGVLVATVLTQTAAATQQPAPAPQSAPPQTMAQERKPTPVPTPASAPVSPTSNASHASPSIRRFAREIGVDLTQVNGTGRKNRITQSDVKGFVKGVMNGSNTSTTSNAQGSGIPPIPAQDFSKFGDIDIQPLNKIKRLTASNLHRSWVNVPHVTHNDESNISDLEDFRKQLNAEYAKQKKDIKLSPLAFIVKALVNAMQLYPQFNSSLEPGGENLIYKKYFHIGIAVDTPNGLVVPVIRDADKKSVAEIATEMGELAKKARDKKLTMTDMSGACMTISSLGGIGGTSFTPIVNAPEVAILGVSRSKIEPVWNGSEFEPGMILPLSLSYDHRVIDGAEAARFTRRVAEVLEDVRRLVV